MKVEKGGVHYKKYNGNYTQPWVRISHVTWTSSILRKRSICWTSFKRASLMKDDVNDEVPNWIPKIIIPCSGVLNLDGVIKLSNKLKRDHAMQLWGWIKILMAKKINLKLIICGWYNCRGTYDVSVVNNG
jgi:hypothetical protein